MAYSETLADRVRKLLGDVSDLEEKKMFGGLAFMVNGKMCVTVGPSRIMCRIDPAIHEAAIAKPGCKTVMMKGRKYIGYVHVDEDQLKTAKALSYWVNLALKFNATLTTPRKK